MKKGHGTVFQNAWSQKKQHSHWKKQFCFKKAHKFIWTTATEPSSKMPEAKKTNTFIGKNILFLKYFYLYVSRPQNRLPKYLKPKKQTLSLKKQFCFKKAYKFIWKKATEPFSEMPEAKRTNTFIEKTIRFQKNLEIHMTKGHRTVFQNAWSQKNQHSHWKNNSPGETYPIAQNAWGKKNNTLVKKTILQKNE